MSILIKGIDMPKNGRVTIELASEDTGTNILARITDNKTGKLIEPKGVVVIFTPHGDLIDRDVLHDYCESLLSESPQVALVSIYAGIDQATPIIEAEE